MKSFIYCDNAATTRPHAKVIESVSRCLQRSFGNPSSVHPEGIAAKKIISENRQILAQIFSLPSESIIFCGSGTESNNLALKGVFGISDTFHGEMITTNMEHASILNSALWLKKYGVTLRYVKNDPITGQIDLDHLEELITPKTKLLSVSHINGETGIIQDIARISSVAKRKNPRLIVHSDGVQAFGKIPLNLHDLGVDLYTISAHKFHGIKGAGALIRCRNIPIQPLHSGGGQEFGIRSGTENVIAIAAFGTAADLAISALEDEMINVRKFSTCIRTKLREDFPHIRMIQEEYTSPHILTFSLANIPGEVLLNHLVDQGVFAGTGSACNENTKKLSPAMKSLNYTPQQIKETLRLSFSASELTKSPKEFYDILKDTIDHLLDFL